jgi:TRAP-type C4-dicarboxylate transport system substrate-binding protein
MGPRAVALACAALLLAAAQPRAETVLKFAAFPPPRGALVEDVLAPWTKAVNAALKGMVEVKLFPGGALGRNPVQQYKLTTDKVVDIAYIVMGYTPGQFPDATIFELPFLVHSSLEGSLAHWRAFEKGLMRGYGDVKMLGLFTIPPQSLQTKFPVQTIADLKGRKIRAAGPYQSAALEILGAVPVSGIAVPAVAEAASRGVVEGTLSDWNGMYSFRLIGITKHHFEVPLGTAAAGIAMNKESFASLPEKARAAIDRLSGEAMSRTHGVEFDKRYRENLARAKKDKSQVFVFPTAERLAELETKLHPVTESWIKGNPDGQKRYDALKAIIAGVRKGM